MYLLILSPGLPTWVWKFFLWMIAEGGGWWWSWTSFASCANDFEVGLSGKTRFRINWYVESPQVLSRMARRFSASSSLMLLAVKYILFQMLGVGHPVFSIWVEFSSASVGSSGHYELILVAKCGISTLKNELFLLDVDKLKLLAIKCPNND